MRVIRLAPESGFFIFIIIILLLLSSISERASRADKDPISNCTVQLRLVL